MQFSSDARGSGTLTIRVEFSRKIALLDETGMSKSRAQCDGFYPRCGTLTRSPFMPNSHRRPRYGRGNVSVLLHGKGNIGAKPKGEVIADILAAIKERRA
jgi:hypothetical protein